MKSVIAATVFLVTAAQAFAEGATGLWQTEPNDEGGLLHISIAPCGAAMCGTIQTAFGPDRQPNSSYEHLGRAMIADMVPDGEDQWGSGTIWAPDQDKTYRAKMELLSADRLKVSGCVAGGLICRGQVWLKVQ